MGVRFVSQGLAGGEAILIVSPILQTARIIAETIAHCPPDIGFQLLGDTIWAMEKGWSLDEIQRLEVNSNHALSTKKKLFLCQYDLHHFGADGAKMVFDTHSLTVYRRDVRQSPYFQGAAL
jgi:hypothetical protein